MTSTSTIRRLRRAWLIIACSATFAGPPALCGAAGSLQGELPEIALAEGNRVITQSVRIKPGRYEFADPDGKGAVKVEADNVTIDFQGATLQSCDVAKAKRDKLTGFGIDVQGRKNVTIRNAKVHGYHYNIRVLDSENVHIEACDVSYSLGHRVMDHGIAVDGFLGLRSVGAWRVYGGGIWMEKVRNGTVRRCSGLYAQNGALLVESNHCLVTDNDFSFNSGWGIGLYQSSDNVVSWNLTDFNVRPDRGRLGGDSASIVVANDCHRNYVVGNSMTHGGDGFFLTNLTDSGFNPKTERFEPKGSSDDNVIAHNDGSWSPCNAFEGTFAYRNVYYKNLANDSGYGFYLGFSCDTLVADNEIQRTLWDGVAIEQGHGNRIEHNTIVDTQVAGVRLCASEGKGREGVPSKDLEIRGNTIRNAKTAVDLTLSTDYYVGDNTLDSAPLPAGLVSTKKPDPTTGLARFLASGQRKKLDEILATRPKGFKFYRETGAPTGTRWIDFDEYCPRDVRTALAAYRAVGWGALDLYVPDPQNTKVVAPDWAAVTADPKAPNCLRVEVAKPDPAVGGLRPYTIKLAKGDRTQEIQGELLDATWHLKWFRWDQPKKLDAADEAGWRGVFASKPILEQTSHNPEWGKIWTVPVPTVPAENWAMSATSRVKLPAGTYRFLAFYAGGMTIKIDGKDVINNFKDSRWMQGGEKIVELSEGEHEIVIHCYREKSYFFLRLYWGLLKPAEKLTYIDVVKRLTDLERLSTLPEPGEKCAQWSSYDRASRYDAATDKYLNWQANGDHNGIIRKEGDLDVLAEMTGPGCIWRMWAAGPREGHVLIYLDGAKEPVTDLPFVGYFNGKNKPFTYPALVHTTAGGWNSYVPIPYQKSCKVVAQKGWGAYYHLTYGTFPKDTTVPTFKRGLAPEDFKALAAANDFLTTRCGSDPAGKRSGEKTETKQLAVSPGQSVPAAEISGERAITAIRVKFDPAKLADVRRSLREVVLKIFWDEEGNPSVWSPLGDFFGTAPGVNKYASLPVGMTDKGECYSLWYMPFARRARVELANDGKQDFPLEIAITHAPLAHPIETLARFHAKWHRDCMLNGDPPRAADWPMLRVNGRGRYCGVMLNVWNPRGEWWGEGDEKFFVDGEKFPSTFGTGTEDYFGYGWCSPVLFQNAFHNQTITEQHRGDASVNRWQIAENVPFQTSIEASIEKDFANNRPTQYAAVAYFYLAGGQGDPYPPAMPATERTDYRTRLKILHVPGALEAEELKIAESTGGGTNHLRMLPWGDDWGNAYCLWWERPRPNDKLTLLLPVEKKGNYEFKAQLAEGGDSAIVQFYLDGQKLGTPVDLYRRVEGRPVAPRLYSLGKQELSAGDHKLMLQVVGINDQAEKAYQVRIDYFKLDPQ